MNIVGVSWNWAIIVEIDTFPAWTWPWSSKRLFSPTTRAFGGIPGVIVRSELGRAGDEVDRRCLLVHERIHWLQWAIVALPGGAACWYFGWPWWSYLAAALLEPALYLAVPTIRTFLEWWADLHQRSCELKHRDR